MHGKGFFAVQSFFAVRLGFLVAVQVTLPCVF
jgi:hypothetical protein